MQAEMKTKGRAQNYSRSMGDSQGGEQETSRVAQLRSYTGTFISHRAKAVLQWGGLAGLFTGETVRALVRFPVFGLFNPKSMLPEHIKHRPQPSKFRRAYDSFASIIGRIGIIPGFLVGIGVGALFGGVLGLMPQSIFGGEKGKVQDGRMLANYLNDHVLRKGTVQYGLLGFVATGALLSLVGLVAALSAEMTLAASGAAVVASLPVMLPAMLSVGALGAAFGLAQGVTHKWHVDAVKDKYELLSNQLDGIGLTPDIKNRVERKLNRLINLALNGDLNAVAQLSSFDVKGACVQSSNASSIKNLGDNLTDLFHRVNHLDQNIGQLWHQLEMVRNATFRVDQHLSADYDQFGVSNPKFLSSFAPQSQPQPASDESPPTAASVVRRDEDGHSSPTTKPEAGLH